MLSRKEFSEAIKKYRKYIIISSILIIGVISIISWSAIYPSNCTSNGTSTVIPPGNIKSKDLLKIQIGRLKYSPEQIVDLSGSVFNSTTRKGTNTTIIIVVNQTANQSSLPWCYSNLLKQRITYFASIPTDKHGNFSYSSLSNQNIGKYNITLYPLDKPQTKYSIPIELVNPFFTLSSYLLYAGIIFFGLLMITTIVPSRVEAKTKEEVKVDQKPSESTIVPSKMEAKKKEEVKNDVVIKALMWILLALASLSSIKKKEASEFNLTTYKILRFIFISGMVISLLGWLSFSEVDLGANSPVGLILQQVVDKNGNPQFDKNNGLPIREWVINIGGNTISSSFAISIPFYVVLLGLMGGYLRYLSKAASKLYGDKDTPEKELKDEKNSLHFAVVTEAELSEIALAPLLATVVWLLLSQGQTTANIYSLAAVSFSVGLITKEIIDGIKRFMTRLRFNTTE